MAKAPSRSRPSAAELLPDGAVCRKCQYSLAGLAAGGVCPECGTPITRGRKRHYLDESMTDAPVDYLKWLAAGCWAMAIAGPAAMIFFLAAFRTSSIVWAGAASAAGLLWFAGVFLVTKTRETSARAAADLQREWRLLRPISRAGAGGWALAGLMYASVATTMQAGITNAAAAGTAFVPTPALIGFSVASAVFALVGLCGLVPLSIILVNLCDWAGDGTLSERLRLAASGIAFGTVAMLVSLPLVLFLSGVLGPLLLILYGVVILGGLSFFAGYLFFLFCIVQLAGMSLWAVSNSITAIERDERIAAKRAEHADQMVNRVLSSQAVTAIPPSRTKNKRPAASVPPAVPRSGPPAAPPPIAKRPPETKPKPGEDRTSATGPYELAPEE